MHANAVLLAALAGSAAALDPRQFSSYSNPYSYSLDPSLSAELACATELASVVAGAPSFPSGVESYFSSYATVSSYADACQFTLPASIDAEYSSYLTPYSSWYAAHSAEIYSIESKCGYLDIASSSYYYTDSCATATATAGTGATATGGATATATTAKTTGETTAAGKTTATTKAATTGTATGTSTGTGTAAATTATGAAARDSVMVGAVIAAAGLFVIAL